MTSEPGTCSSCGTALPSDAPQGLCPRCLYRLGFAEATPSPPSLPPGSSTPAPGPSPLPRGLGDYELLEEIGHGGMGVVYKARQRSLDRLVALKLLLFGPHASPESVKRFRAEAVATAALQHPSIVAIHEVGCGDGQHFLAMEYVPGQPMSALIGGTPLPARRAAGYVRRIAEAIHYAHEHGILHRDLKPANVLIDTNDQPRVTDFGLARRLEGDSELTVTGQVLGSPHYMPPEQAAGKRGTVSRRTDVYALGAILYHALTGRPPFVGEGLAETVQQVLHAEPVSPRALHPSVPVDLETVCLKCLQKEPGKRYATAHLLAEDLGRFLEGKPVLARPVGPAGKTWRWCRRNPRLAVAVAVALGSLLLGLAGASWQWGRAEAQRARAEAGERFARQNTYAADMHLAQLALADHNHLLARSLLDKHRPVAGGRAENSKPKPDGRTRHAERAADLRGWEWRYLWQLCQGDHEFTLHRYPSPVSALAVSSDGRLLAVATRDEVALWDLTTRRPRTGLPFQPTRALAFAPAGHRLAVGTWDAAGRSVVELCEAGEGTVTKTRTLQAGNRSLAFSPDGQWLATLTVEGNLKITEVASGRTVREFTVQPLRTGEGGAVSFAPDGRHLAIGQDYGGLRLLDIDAGTFHSLPTRTDASISALALSPAAGVLAAGFSGSEGPTELWQVGSWESHGPLTNHTQDVNALVFSPDGRQLVSAGNDGTIRVWSVADRAERRRLQSARERPTALALLPDGHTVVSGGSAGSVCFWNTARPARPPVHTNLEVSLGFESMRGIPPEGFAPNTLDPKVARRFGLAFSPDSRSFISLDREGSLGVWETDTFRLVERLPALGSNHWAVALSPDGQWLATGDHPGGITLWDWTTRRAATNVALPFEWFGLLRFSRTGRYFIAASARNNWTHHCIRIWRTGDWAEVPLTGRAFDGLWPVDLSPDDRFLAVGYLSGALSLFRFPSLEHEATLTRHLGIVFGVLFSPDGRKLVSVDFDGSVRVWEVEARREQAAPLRGHLGIIMGGTLSPDGRRLATGGSNARDAVKLWDLTARREVLSLHGDGLFFTHLTFSPDGNTLAATAMSGMAHLWRAPSWAEIEAQEDEPHPR